MVLNQLFAYDSQLTTHLEPTIPMNRDDLSFRAHDQDWTDDLILTKDVLYQLSYVGNFGE